MKEKAGVFLIWGWSMFCIAISFYLMSQRPQSVVPAYRLYLLVGVSLTAVLPVLSTLLSRVTKLEKLVAEIRQEG